MAEKGGDLMEPDFGVARGYICPVRLVYSIQPLSYGTSGAVSPEELEEAYRKVREERMEKVLSK